MHNILRSMKFFPLIIAGCNAPTSLISEFEAFTSKEEGAEIQIHCEETNERTISQCVNSSWSPDPLTLVCVKNPIGELPQYV